MPTDPTTPTAGRSLVSRRAVVDIVRAATLGSYGVIGFAGGPLGRLAEWIGLPPAGLRVRVADGIAIELDLVVAHGVPIAEVARQVDSAVRYAIRHAVGREVERLVIHVGGLRVGLAGPAGLARDDLRRDPQAVGPDDLAGSGSDVA